MQPSSLFAILSSVAAAAAAALAPEVSLFNGLPSGYTLGNITWMGNVTANGPEVSFTGASFHDIEAQIRQANPSFEWPTHDTADLPDFLNKDIEHLSCNLPQFWWAVKFRIEEGIDYLNGKTGRCYIPAGPQYCSRISCSYHSAIFWCNDNDHAVWIDCSLWSQYAQAIIDKCTVDDPSQDTKGQQFSTENWNIIVGYSEC
ncbi:hypothetical protein F4821DRAFT_281077 [Hypoxylon rubiginosum]|uniref:Uncharacterized protein n=1 Tax=Hypoxylon rubiginosum TaxID=110542 RepID=A0ACC0CS15_9PEZI|nr:hypothetical protein F4821DRAFT_281077 [Hypoxylon rubiginosum]